MLFLYNYAELRNPAFVSFRTNVILLPYMTKISLQCINLTNHGCLNDVTCVILQITGEIWLKLIKNMALYSELIYFFPIYIAGGKSLIQTSDVDAIFFTRQ